jgi:hypothetical protein
MLARVTASASEPTCSKLPFDFDFFLIAVIHSSSGDVVSYGETWIYPWNA